MFSHALDRAGRIVRAAVAWDPTLSLTERLWVWVDQAGRLLASGLEACALQRRTAFAVARGTALGEGEEGAEKVWVIPIAAPPCQVTVSTRQTHEAGVWSVRCAIESETDAGIAAETRITIREENGPLTLGGRLHDIMTEPAQLRDGAWRLTLEVGADMFHIPLVLGTPVDDTVGGRGDER